MTLQTIDIAIIILYLLVTVGIGFWISRKASKNIQQYFLGGNEIKWTYLGLSNASGMFDISGTMWMVALLFVYGLKSVWIPWLWPVFNQIFLMVYLSLWLRRSGVMTGAEWIKFRFGDGRGATLSHLIVVVFAIIVVITYVAYGFIGIGKFGDAFLPWDLATYFPADLSTAFSNFLTGLTDNPEQALSPNEILYGLIFTGLTAIYVVKGGMYSVVFTEVLQYIIMTIASIAIGIIAMNKVSPEMLTAFIPAGWTDLSFGWELGLDWTGVLDSVNTKISQDGWELFSIFFMMLLLKGILQSMAGPAPNYDMQRILSTRTPKEAAKMSGFVNVVLLFPRYMLITGLTILALVYFSDTLKTMGEDIDFEQILPFAIKNFVPAGLMGLLIAGLLAAFMSSFAAAVNAAPAYLVNDIYKRFITPDASDKAYVRMSYATSLAVVLIGTLFGFLLGSLNELIEWLVAALYGGYTAANLLKWYWWRFNGYGYFWGMIAGILAAMLLPLVLPDHISALEAFPINLALSLLGCIMGSYLTRPESDEVLEQFYLQTRPWGYWKPVYEKIKAKHPHLKPNNNFGRDSFNVIIGIIWQTAITASPIFMVIQHWGKFGVSLLIVGICTVILKYNWYDKMEDYPADFHPLK